MQLMKDMKFSDSVKRNVIVGAGWPTFQVGNFPSQIHNNFHTKSPQAPLIESRIYAYHIHTTLRIPDIRSSFPLDSCATSGKRPNPHTKIRETNPILSNSC